MTIYEQIAADADFGRAAARKTGNNPCWPYVPVVITAHPITRWPRQEQLSGKAFVTREEAVAYAESHIARLRADLARKLGEPPYRALREQYGLPREI